MARRLDELRDALAAIERRIETVVRGDGFIEDLIDLQKRRNAALAELRYEALQAEDIDDIPPVSQARAARRQ